MKVAVVGAGIAGLSTAWGLVRRGHDVLVFDRGSIPNPAAASYDQHRLIRYHYPDRPLYARMTGEAYAAWDTMWDEIGRRHYVETGALGLSRAAGDWTDRAAQALDEAGYGYDRLMPADIDERFPFLETSGVAWGLYMQRGGVLLADRIVTDLAVHLRERGVTLNEHAEVVEIDAARGAVRLAGGLEIAADAIVVAAGAWAPKLLPGEAARLRSHRVLCVYVDPPERYAEAWARGPGMIDYGFPDDHWSVPPVAGTQLKLSVAGNARPGDPDDDRQVTDGEAASMLARYRPVLRDIDAYRILNARTCCYTYAPEERFVVEQHGRSWLVSACSGHGFKFGALVGLTLAEALAGGTPPEQVRRWAAALEPAPAET
ncbi:MAG TPA: FAD-dependent oxidoreductase [Alphaproteobacteria bacterium]|nr:FAD-dependent oxidoreductase [Alphaproteobacteria bacterium]